MSNLRDKYLSTRPGKLASVEVEGWGTVLLRSLTLSEMDELRQLETTDGVTALVRTFTLAVSDERGQRVFSDDDAARVRELPVSVIKQVSEAAAAHTVASVERVADAKKD